MVTHHKDKTALQQIEINNLLETNFLAVDKDANLRELVKVIAASKRNIFPVLSKNKDFIGIVYLDDIRDIIFKPELYDSINVKELMYMPKYVVYEHENNHDVVKKFNEGGDYNLPVVDENNKYLGFISRANFFTNYREIVEELSQD